MLADKENFWGAFFMGKKWYYAPKRKVLLYRTYCKDLDKNCIFIIAIKIRFTLLTLCQRQEIRTVSVRISCFFSYCQRALNGLAGGTATKRSYFTEKRAGQTTGETVVCKPPDSECTEAQMSEN